MTFAKKESRLEVAKLEKVILPRMDFYVFFPIFAASINANTILIVL